jgi:FtsP/CotA-like multicopper oxidase with cupredoxin domain
VTPPRRGPARRRANPPAACWRPHAAARDVVPDLRTGRSTAARAPAPNLRLGWPPRPVGPTLDLVRGEPVRITVVNRLPEPTAVHWHGIELESYYDGVPGFSGLGRRTTPLIAPGDSFEVRFTPPRAGTFIYHTHADEERQQLAGLAGALVVREPGTTPDPARDIPVLVTEAADSAGRPSVVLVNGRAAPAPLELRAGTTYRLRFIQMAVSRSAVRLELLREREIAAWRPVAKDGAELPAAGRGVSPARTRLGIGETYDVELTPEAPGDLRLELRAGVRWPAPSVLLTQLPIRVTPAADHRRP